MNTNGRLIHIQQGTYAFTSLCLSPTLIFMLTFYLGLGDFPGSSAGKESAYNSETPVQLLGLED